MPLSLMSEANNPVTLSHLHLSLLLVTIEIIILFSSLLVLITNEEHFAVFLFIYLSCSHSVEEFAKTLQDDYSLYKEQVENCLYYIVNERGSDVKNWYCWFWIYRATWPYAFL